MVGPMSPDRRRMLEKNHLRILRRPTPHVYPNIDLSNYVYGPDALGWTDWRRLRGPGVRSWLRWLAAFLTLSGPTQAEQNFLTHHHMLDERKCHSWRGMGWCFCEEAE
jgi:hypothetical protein